MSPPTDGSTLHAALLDIARPDLLLTHESYILRGAIRPERWQAFTDNSQRELTMRTDTNLCDFLTFRESQQMP